MQKKREEMRAWSDSEASKSETSKAEGEKETKSNTKVLPLWFAFKLIFKKKEYKYIK